MKKMKFIIRLGIFNKHLRLGNMAYFNIFYKVSICNFIKKCHISSSDDQKYILQMLAVEP